jgi:hypothetical protein
MLRTLSTASGISKFSTLTSRIPVVKPLALTTAAKSNAQIGGPIAVTFYANDW